VVSGIWDDIRTSYNEFQRLHGFECGMAKTVWLCGCERCTNGGKGKMIRGNMILGGRNIRLGSDVGHIVCGVRFWAHILGIGRRCNMMAQEHGSSG
jgi:hypothetical protein